MKTPINTLLTGVIVFFSFISSADQFITLQSTTSTENSGLYKTILPIFEKQFGIKVRVVAVGTGQAIKNAKNGDGDVLLVHTKSAEEKFVAEGYGVKRFDVMYNDFVIVGPAEDPAGIAREKDVTNAMTKIASTQSIFVSRGDDSGTHKKELKLWKETNINPQDYSGQWYRESGSGMGATLNAGVAMNGYVLTDRSTWMSFKNKQNFVIHFEHESSLFNQYGVTLVNNKKHPHVKIKEGQIFVDWLISEAGQTAIANYKLAGQQVFFPNAHRPLGKSRN